MNTHLHLFGISALLSGTAGNNKIKMNAYRGDYLQLPATKASTDSCKAPYIKGTLGCNQAQFGNNERYGAFLFAIWK